MSLYRHHRPQYFRDLIGQNHIRITLEQQIIRKLLSHAYLFTGPRGVGKTTVARLLAKAANCSARTADQSEPCGACTSCIEIASGRSLDVVEIDAASYTGVDMVREAIIENVRFAPHRDAFKVYIIDEVHMLSLSAFNALLKTLEEPPQHALFILATTELHKVPETIISRCQRFDFRRVPHDQIAEMLRRIAAKENMNVDDRVFVILAQRSSGFVRDAVSLLGQVRSLGGKRITADDIASLIPSSDVEDTLALVQSLCGRRATEAIAVIGKVVNEGCDLETFVQDVILLVRCVLLVSVAQDDADVYQYDEEMRTRVRTIARIADRRDLTRMLHSFAEVLTAIRSAYLPALPLEVAVVELCEGGDEGTDRIDQPLAPGEDLSISQKNPPLKEMNTEYEKPKTGASHIRKDPAGRAKERVVVSLDIETVREKWPEILEAGKENQSLRLLLNVVFPVSVADGHVELGCEYEFHKKQIEDQKMRMVLERIFSRVFGGTVFVRGVSMAAESLTEARNFFKPRTTVQSADRDEAAAVKQLIVDFGGKLAE